MTDLASIIKLLLVGFLLIPVWLYIITRLITYAYFRSRIQIIDNLCSKQIRR